MRVRLPTGPALFVSGEAPREVPRTKTRGRVLFVTSTNDLLHSHHRPLQRSHSRIAVMPPVDDLHDLEQSAEQVSNSLRTHLSLRGLPKTPEVHTRMSIPADAQCVKWHRRQQGSGGTLVLIPNSGWPRCHSIRGFTSLANQGNRCCRLPSTSRRSARPAAPSTADRA